MNDSKFVRPDLKMSWTEMDNKWGQVNFGWSQVELKSDLVKIRPAKPVRLLFYYQLFLNTQEQPH